MTTAAAQKRYDAIRAVTDKFIDLNESYNLKRDLTVAYVCEQIETLRSLGRTERWNIAITGWQNMVKEADGIIDSDSYKRRLHGAIIQGNIGMSYAAQ